jgi:hypothetical protein
MNKIKINPANKGKFTASAKAEGESVQEHAAEVLDDPKASGLQKKRANFARNAAKWNHKGKKNTPNRSMKRFMEGA